MSMAYALAELCTVGCDIRNSERKGVRHYYAPVQVPRDEHWQPGPHTHLVACPVEHHCSTELALRIADLVQMRVDQRDVARGLSRTLGQTEEGERS